MIRQRKQPNAKEAKTLKIMGEFKRSGFGSWKTSGIAASHRLASYLSDPREARRIAANIAKLYAPSTMQTGEVERLNDGDNVKVRG
jgi:hypothetical protein